jgi:hypothetical protein
MASRALSLGAFLICQGQKKLHIFYKLKGLKQYERSNNKETFTYYSSASRLTVPYLMCSMGDGNAQQSCREILNKLLTAVVGFMLTGGFCFIFELFSADICLVSGCKN